MKTKHENTRQRRRGKTTTRTHRVEFRVRPSKKGLATVTGLAVPYNELSEDLGGFREKFLPGAFRGSLLSDVFVDIEHDRTAKLGRTTAGTARLREDAKGLWVTVDLPDTTTGRDALAEIEAGLLDGMSIAFTDPTERWRGSSVREISSAKLRAVTLTAYPAYPQTVGKVKAKAPLGTAKRAQQDADEDRRRRQQTLEAQVEADDALRRAPIRGPRGDVELARRRLQLLEAEGA
jgi:HK97 family phage prohead protease